MRVPRNARHIGLSGWALPCTAEQHDAALGRYPITFAVRPGSNPSASELQPLPSLLPANAPPLPRAEGSGLGVLGLGRLHVDPYNWTGEGDQLRGPLVTPPAALRLPPAPA
eukprot:SAG11_NODE_1539_length_4722_cov_4.377028_5_plen_111_part_00